MDDAGGLLGLWGLGFGVMGFRVIGGERGGYRGCRGLWQHFYETELNKADSREGGLRGGYRGF